MPLPRAPAPCVFLRQFQTNRYSLWLRSPALIDERRYGNQQDQTSAYTDTGTDSDGYGAGVHALIAAHDNGRRTCRCLYGCCRCARGCRGCDAVGVELGSENVCGLPDDRHGIKRTREAQDLVGGGAAAAAAGPTAIVAVVRVGRCRVAAEDRIT